MNLPELSNYRQTRSADDPKAVRVDFGPVTVWFSYATVVAFRVCGHGLVVSKNVWSTTTGKHLNQIDGGDKGGRVDRDEFERLWREQTSNLNLSPEAV